MSSSVTGADDLKVISQPGQQPSTSVDSHPISTAPGETEPHHREMQSSDSLTERTVLSSSDAPPEPPPLEPSDTPPPVSPSLLRDTTGSIPTKYEERLNIIQDSGTLPTTLDALREAIRSEWVGARMVVDSNPPPPPNSGPNENITRLWQLESLAIAIDARINNSPCRGLNSETFTSLGAGGYNSVFQCPDPLCALKPTALLCSDPKILIRHAFDGVGPKTLTGSAFGSYAKNMGSKVIADMLSTPDVPSTLKVTVDVFPATDSEGKSYIGMELASGKPILSTDLTSDVASNINVFFNNNQTATSTYLREATWLQVQDILTGQVDRHNENLFVNRTTGHIMAFDFDHSFPTEQARPTLANRCPQVIQNQFKAKAIDGIGGKNSRNFCMPPVIDEVMRDKIMQITPETLRTALLPVGLSQAEIEASVNRLAHMQRLISDDDDDALGTTIIEPTTWNIANLQEEGCDSNNLYAFNFFSLK